MLCGARVCLIDTYVHIYRFVLLYSFADEDTKNPCAQFLVTNETNTASFGDLRHIINFDTETICVDFESPIGIIYIAFIFLLFFYCLDSISFIVFIVVAF